MLADKHAIRDGQHIAQYNWMSIINYNTTIQLNMQIVTSAAGWREPASDYTVCFEHPPGLGTVVVIEVHSQSHAISEAQRSQRRRSVHHTCVKCLYVAVCVMYNVWKCGVNIVKWNWAHVPPPRTAKKPAMAATPTTAAAVRSLPPKLCGGSLSSLLPFRALLANSMNASYKWRKQQQTSTEVKNLMTTGRQQQTHYETPNSHNHWRSNSIKNIAHTGDKWLPKNQSLK